MALRRASELFNHLEQGERQEVKTGDKRSASKLADTLSDKVFKKDSLDRKLERHHITGNRHRSAFEGT